MRVSLLRRRTVLAALAAAAGAPSWSQGRVVRLVVAFPAGGPVDFVARTLAEPLGRELGQPVVVENRAGANGAIAAEFVARSAPDAGTLWLTSVGAVAINPALYEKLAYDPQRDFVPVALVVDNVEVLVVPAAAPYADGSAFVAAARQQPGKISMASTGSGSVPHLALELLAESARVDLLHVPYKGAAPAITDLVAGHVQGFFGDIPGLIGHIRSGRLRAIGLAARQRHPLLPDVKTFDEMGVAGVDSDNWYALFAARGTPAADVERVSQAVRRALAQPEVRDKLLASGAQPAASSPAELAALLRTDSVKWAHVVKTRNIKAD